jgi:hypothetical protein
MKKWLLPSAIMIATYLVIHLAGFVVGKSHHPTSASVSWLKNKQPQTGFYRKNKKHLLTYKNQVRKQTKKNTPRNKVKLPALLNAIPINTKYQVPMVSFLETSEKNIDLVYQRTGTEIHIPANAFISKSGDPVKGTVEIRYREFITPSEIFTSGIPMHLQGDEYLESAGMFEVEAWQQGEQLVLAPQVEIEVSMNSSFTDQDYNLYSFNNTNQNWDYENNNFSYSAVTSNSIMEDWRNISNDELPEYVTEKKEYYVPVKDVVGFNPDYEDALHKKQNTIYRQASVKLVYESTLFPDLAALGTYEYKILTHTYSELENMANTVMNKETSLPMGWKDLKIVFPGQQGVVDLKFINDLDTFTLGAEPIVNTLGAKKKYANEYYAYAAYYEQARLGRLSIKKFKMGLKKVDFEKDTTLVKQLKTMKIAEKVERKFLADKLMVWNCDRPFPIRPYESVSVNFVSDRVTHISKIYAAIPGKNSVLQATDFVHFPLVNHGEMYVWVLVEENLVAYATPEMMRDIKWDKKEINDIPLKTMSLDAFLPMLDRDILKSKEKLTEFVL